MNLCVDKTSIANWEKHHTEPELRFYPAILGFLGYDPLPRAETLAGELVRYRTVRGISQKVLAERLRIDPSTLARWERGERRPVGQYAERLKTVLGLAD